MNNDDLVSANSRLYVGIRFVCHCFAERTRHRNLCLQMVRCRVLPERTAPACRTTPALAITSRSRIPKLFTCLIRHTARQLRSLSNSRGASQLSTVMLTPLNRTAFCSRSCPPAAASSALHTLSCQQRKLETKIGSHRDMTAKAACPNRAAKSMEFMIAYSVG
jgi:hypothetical protein